MAILQNLNLEAVELFRGTIDFYVRMGKTPVARKWPRKIKPPYTERQREAMAVFSLAAGYTSRIREPILSLWRSSTEGSRQQWTDVIKGIFMTFWKKNNTLPLVVMNFNFNFTDTDLVIDWYVIQPSLTDPEISLTIHSDPIPISDLRNKPQPVYITLLDDFGNRHACPMIPVILP